MANEAIGISSKIVTVFGGSGFLGRHAVQALARRGYRIRPAVRRPDLAGFLQPLGMVGQVMPVQANLRFPSSVAKAAEGRERRHQPRRHPGAEGPPDLRGGARCGRAGRCRNRQGRGRPSRPGFGDRGRSAGRDALSAHQGRGRKRRRSRCLARWCCGLRCSSGRRMISSIDSRRWRGSCRSCR